MDLREFRLEITTVELLYKVMSQVKCAAEPTVDHTSTSTFREILNMLKINTDCWKDLSCLSDPLEDTITAHL